MEDIPPSYESAVNRDAWEVIAPWISSRDLCAASLVSRKWHSIFAPFLWGDPASHFGIENDAVYVALTRFKRTLRRARLHVRQLTHTLHLPPALSEIYGGPNSAWLRDVLDHLPNLQSLLVSQLPFFDHHALVFLKRASNTQPAETSEESKSPQYGLKLLSATHEPNTTSLGLQEAIIRFPQLIYLDLSYTKPARDVSVLSGMETLSGLRVLKLRGIGMRDREAEALANAIGIRVRVLDLRNNVLSDMAIRSLMQACFPVTDVDVNASNSRIRNIEDWPLGITPGPDHLSLDTLKSEDLDEQLLKQLTHPLTGRLAIEDIPNRGLTHLYIADNRLSVEGLASLLKSKRLHVLDAGSVDTANALEKTRPKSVGNPYDDRVDLPGPEKLAPTLEQCAAQNLTYLRMNHAIITKKALSKELPSPSTLAPELPGDGPRFELEGAGELPFELPANEAVFELSAEAPTPRLELPGDCIHLTLSPPIGEPPRADKIESQPTPVRGDGAFAPELVESDLEADHAHESGDEELVLNATGSGFGSKKRQSQGNSGSVSGLQSPKDMTPTPPAPYSPSAERAARIDFLLRKRTSCSVPISGQTKPPTNYLHPSALPHVRSLVLTDVPTQVPQSSLLISALIGFVSGCADEAFLALLQAQTNYSLPPGRSRISAEITHARTLFALQTIVLEMSPVNRQLEQRGLSNQMSGLSPWVSSPTIMGWTRSSTGDRDSENLWSAAERDFSFFGEEGEEHDECGVYDNEPEKYFPMAALNEKVVLGPEDASTPSTPDSFRSIEPSMKSPNYLQSPRTLPLRRRAASNASSTRGSFESQDRPAITSAPRAELPRHVPSQASPTTKFTAAEEPLLDVVAELAKFRRAKKAEYEEALVQRRTNSSPNRSSFASHIAGPISSPAHSVADLPFIEGHWKGEIKIIRNAAPKGRSGIVDIYGNYFEKGYLYP